MYHTAREQSPLTTSRESPRYTATRPSAAKKLIKFTKLNILNVRALKKMSVLIPISTSLFSVLHYTYFIYHSTYKSHALCPFHWSPRVCNLCVFVSPSHLTYSLAVTDLNKFLLEFLNLFLNTYLTTM